MVTPRGVGSRREGRRSEEQGLMEFYYSLIDLLWRSEWTLRTTLSLTLISIWEGEARWGGGGGVNACPLFRMAPPNPLHQPSPALLLITKDKVSSRLTGRRCGWPSWIPVSRGIAVANGPAELRWPPRWSLHLFINGGPCATPYGWVRRAEINRNCTTGPFRPLAAPAPTPQVGPKQFVNT